MKINLWSTLVIHTSFFRGRVKFTTFLQVKEVILGTFYKSPVQGQKIRPQVDQDSGGSPHMIDHVGGKLSENSYFHGYTKLTCTQTF